MANFYYCLGYWLDLNCCEHICKNRDNCKYYDVDVYSKFKHIWNQFDFLVCFEPCRYYSPRREEVVVELGEDEDPFAT